MCKDIVLSSNDLFLLTDSLQLRVNLLNKDMEDPDIQKYPNVVKLLNQSVKSLDELIEKLNAVQETGDENTYVSHVTLIPTISV